jgi:DNA polymerase I
VIASALIDADYITLEDRAVVRLWVKSGPGVIKILDPGFEPYFYLVPFDPDRGIEGVGGVERVDRERMRDEMGAEVEVFKITCSHPKEVPRLRELLKDYGEVREADIPFAIRYIIDKDLEPMGGVEANGELVNGDLWARSVMRVEVEPSKLKVLAFDMEVYNPKGVPNPDEDPIVMISVATEDWTKVIEARGLDDGSAIKSFIDLLMEEDPDVIVGYNSNNFDWPYLKKRCEVNSIPLRVGRDGSEMKYWGGALPRVSITGRGIVDLYRVVDRDLPDIKIKTLVSAAQQLGIVRQEDRTNIPKDQIHRYWDSEELRKELKEYTIDDVESTLELGLELLPTQIELAKLIRAPLTDVTTMGRGRQVEHYLITRAHREGIIVPNRGEMGGRGVREAYEGGFVLSPKPGIHEKVVCLDFSSMYPTIMVSFNVSPDTLLQNGDGFEAPGVGYRFRKSPDGFFKKILGELIGRRREIKEEMRSSRRGSKERKLLDIRQQTVKVLTNSFYGYTGWQAARWYKRECAEATSAWGRHLIKQAVARAEGEGMTVLYGDTDSLFVKDGERVPRLVEEINKEMPVELEVAEEYEAIFFTGKKKRYAGLTSDGALVIRGLEVRRGDWCDLAKRLQREIIDQVLREKNVEGAVEKVRRTVKRLKEGDFSIDEITIHKGLMKPLSSYRSQQAHVRAAKRAMEEGIVSGLGSKIAFVVTKGSGPMSERSKVVELVKDKGEVDVDYYIDNQIVPTALRMLELFGFAPEDLKGKPKQLTLDRF